MKINNTEILPGENAKVKIRVGYLPSGTEINIFAHVFRSKNEGKTALVMAGVHGDEINGVEILRRFLEEGIFENLKSGNVIVVPLLNVFGFINFSRDVPDGKDVNRSFPGNSKGSLASRVARKLTKSILPLVDFGIDLHTGGDSRYNYPQIRYTKEDAAGKELAVAFNAPLTITRPRILHSLRKVAGEMKIPVIVFEGGESKRLDGYSIEQGTQGIKNVLMHFGLLEAVPLVEKKDSLLVNRTSWIRADDAGLFIWAKSSGCHIKKGEILGVIKDVHGSKTINVLAKSDGVIVGHNNAPVVNSGDALFHVGYFDKQN